MEDVINKDTLAEFHYSAAEIKLLDKVKSTKFILSVLSVIILTTVLCTGYIPASTFAEVMQFTLGAYILGDSFQKSKWSK